MYLLPMLRGNGFRRPYLTGRLVVMYAPTYVVLLCDGYALCCVRKLFVAMHVHTKSVPFGVYILYVKNNQCVCVCPYNYHCFQITIYCSQKTIVLKMNAVDGSIFLKAITGLGIISSIYFFCLWITNEDAVPEIVIWFVL